jgi:hypothetical protein
MKPWRKRLGRSLSPKPLLGGLFAKIEASSPSAAGILRYHSDTRVLDERDCLSTIYRPIRVFDDRYIRHYETVRNLEPFSLASTSNTDQVPIHTAFLENMVIHGHIKAPIDAVTGKATSFYFPHARLDWGDVYPLPVRRREIIKGDVIFIPRLTNLFHLLVEHVIPTFAAAIRSRPDLQKKITIISQVNFPLLSIFVEYLNYIGIDAELRFISHFDELYVERLLTSRAKAQDADFNYAYAEEMALMSEFLDKKIKNIDVPERVYIERSHTPRRQILNQAELIKSLSENDIQSIKFSFENYLTQIAVFRKSHMIISAHGAALTNIAFAKPSQNIIEVFPEDLRPKCYINMASQHDLNYLPIIGSKQSGNEHFSIPIGAVLHAVQSNKREP